MGGVPLPIEVRLTPELELRLMQEASDMEDASSLYPILEAERAAVGTIRVEHVEVKDCQEVESAPFHGVKW